MTHKKTWIQKLLNQFELDRVPAGRNTDSSASVMSDEKATVLFMIDLLARHLIETNVHSVRKTREMLDEYAREIAQAPPEKLEKALFRWRQFLTSFRIEEVTFVQRSFDDFRQIIWDFVDQLAEDVSASQRDEGEIQKHFQDLREAVETNSLEQLRTSSRLFIDSYTELQVVKERRKEKRLESMRKNLHTVKKQLSEAHHDLHRDHLTGLANRRAFEERVAHIINLKTLYQKNATLLAFDIDHFKKINDQWGHDVGDAVLVEFAKVLGEVFAREQDCVARVGGEEFLVLLPDFKLEHAIVRAEQALTQIRAAVLVHQGERIQWTSSIGIAELQEQESLTNWTKRADTALYLAKNSGRNRFQIADQKVAKIA